MDCVEMRSQHLFFYSLQSQSVPHLSIPKPSITDWITLIRISFMLMKGKSICTPLLNHIFYIPFVAYQSEWSSSGLRGGMAPVGTVALFWQSDGLDPGGDSWVIWQSPASQLVREVIRTTLDLWAPYSAASPQKAQPLGREWLSKKKIITS